MNHAITIGEVLGFVGAIAALFGGAALILFIIWFLNPFRTGH